MTINELEMYKGTGFYKSIPAFSTRDICWKIKGIEDEQREQKIRNILLGDVEFFSNVEESEYCSELKKIVEQGYFEMEYCNGALTKRIDIPKDWKPKMYETSEADKKPETAKRKPFKNWFFRNGLTMLSVGGLLLGILGVVLALTF